MTESLDVTTIPKQSLRVLSPTPRLLLGGAAPVPDDQTVVFGIMPATYINPSGAASFKPDLEFYWLLDELLRRGDEEMRRR
jgi:hypothetical protein